MPKCPVALGSMHAIIDCGARPSVEVERTRPASVNSKPIPQDDIDELEEDSIDHENDPKL